MTTLGTLHDSGIATVLRPVMRMLSIVGAAALALVLGGAPWLGTPARADNLVATIPVGSFPIGVGVNPTTNKVYVANSGFTSSSVSVINGATNQVLGTLQFQSGVQPTEVAVNPNTNRIYVGNFGSNTVTVIDGSKDVVETTITVGLEPDGIAIDPKSNTIYVANQFSRTVSIIDGSKNAVRDTIGPLDNAPAGATVNPKTNQVYLANLFSSSLSVIQVGNNRVTQIPLDTIPFGIGFNPTANKIYVANRLCSIGTTLESCISVLDATTNTLLAEIPSGNSFNLELTFGVNPRKNRVYATNQSGNSVLVIDGVTDRVINTFPVGPGPFDVAANPVTNRIYVSNFFGGSVSVIQDS